MIISIGGSVSTGSTPWIDIISAYDEVRVMDGELRIGESGLYDIVSKIYANQTPTEDEFLKVKNTLIGFGEKNPIASRVVFYFLLRLPGVSASIIEKVNQYQLGKRSYDKRLPGFSLFSKKMLKDLNLLLNDSSLETSARKLKIQQLMGVYFLSLRNIISSDKKVVFDQLFTPKLLFDIRYGCAIPDILSNVKIVVVRRDPRDQFIDLLLKRKKRYHTMKPSEAVSHFVSEYLPRYDRMSAMLENCDPSKVIDVWFEDIFFDFETALCKLEDFAELKTRPAVFNCFDFSDAFAKVKMYESGKFSNETAYIKDNMRRHLYKY
ncbi:sulfotransferase [Vreelandella sp. V005]|uniref:sulfotransferase n=1 Tax=Vreelandella sp. V005 TaxID=3459608 RepID=UPI004044451A